MDEMPAKQRTRVEEILRSKKPKDLVSYLQQELENGNVTAVQVLKYSQSTQENSTTLTPVMINDLGRVVSKLQDAEQAKLKLIFYKLAADRGCAAGCGNYARLIQHKNIDEAIVYAKRAIEFTKEDNRLAKRKDFYAGLLKKSGQQEEPENETGEDVLPEMAKLAIDPIPPGLYKAKTVGDVRVKEVEVQKYVHDRFFRFAKPLKPNSKSLEIYNRLIAIDEKSKRDVQGKSRDQLSENISGFKPIGALAKLAAEFYLKESVVLDGCSARSVIIALSKLLNEKGSIPTAVYQIGKTRILCLSVSNFGKVLLQTITEEATVLRNPSVYGDGKAYSSMFAQLEIVTQAATKGTNIHELLRQSSRNISSLGHLDTEPYYGFLDKLNFLRAIIEVARYSSRPQQEKGDLDGLPIGVSQQRTSQLLIEGKIKTAQAYGGADSSSKSPLGVVTGTSLKTSIKGVESKTHTINAEYNKRYYKFFAVLTDNISVDDAKDKGVPKPLPGEFDHPVVEGPSLLKSKLKEEFGSAGEDNSDYSDQEAANALKGLEKVRPKK